jgi:hypothetical protein
LILNCQGFSSGLVDGWLIQLEVWKEIEEPERHISPLGKMYQQAEDMKTTENINANCIEPQYEYQGLVSTIFSVLFLLLCGK